jgi:hypothetical protein
MHFMELGIVTALSTRETSNKCFIPYNDGHFVDGTSTLLVVPIRKIIPGLAYGAPWRQSTQCFCLDLPRISQLSVEAILRKHNA